MFYISTKYHRNIPKGIRVTERTRNLFQIKQRVITLKVREPELSILYARCHLILIYISTKYHPIGGGEGHNFGRGSPKEHFCEIILKSGHLPRRCLLKVFQFLALAAILCSGAIRFEQFW